MLGSYSCQQPHIGAALVQLQPALLDSALDAGAELRAACLERVEEWVVDLLDVDSAILLPCPKPAERADARRLPDRRSGVR